MIGAKTLIGIFLTAGAVLVGYDYSQFQSSQETLYATVLNKERICTTDYDEDNNPETTCVNYVHTDRETFINDGVIWAGFYNATAMQGRLVPGTQYTFRVYGTANERLGSFRRIIQVAPMLPGGGGAGGAGAGNW